MNENQKKYINHPKVKIVNHPLVQHKLSILRDKNTSSNKSRQLVKEVALLLGYEATRDMLLEDVEIETPLQKMTAKKAAGKKTLIVPIIRAGLAFQEALLELVPSARVGHLGMYRDEKTHKPVTYFDKMPSDAAERQVIVVDPMLATGGSINMAVNYLRGIGIKGTITIMVLIAVPEGIKAVLDNDDDVKIVTGAIDEGLNKNSYILPGIGDAGDRIYGTK